MSPTVTETADVSTGPGTALENGAAETGATEDEVLAELLVEEISIDGMCGVY
jgi:mycofactocin precursor